MHDLTWEEIEIGLTHSFTITITDENVDAFVKLSGDTNPLHVDAAFAQKEGYKDRVVHGMFLASYYSTLVGLYLPGKHALLHSVDSQFKNPAFVSDSLTITGKVTHKNDAYKQMEIKATIKNQDEKVLSKALIKTGVLK
ncbi:dehydratase [Candidatus Marinamargulisbacteria bacterium SCGC AAA071-K20]|nr:dehydratase [Candidatus Marinamargulisbacteria bacterium SCGC AAA071-K20]